MDEVMCKLLLLLILIHFSTHMVLWVTLDTLVPK